MSLQLAKRGRQTLARIVAETRVKLRRTSPAAEEIEDQKSESDGSDAVTGKEVLEDEPAVPPVRDKAGCASQTFCSNDGQADALAFGGRQLAQITRLSKRMNRLLLRRYWQAADPSALD